MKTASIAIALMAIQSTSIQAQVQGIDGRTIVAQKGGAHSESRTSRLAMPRKRRSSRQAATKAAVREGRSEAAIVRGPCALCTAAPRTSNSIQSRFASPSSMRLTSGVMTKAGETAFTRMPSQAKSFDRLLKA